MRETVVLLHGLWLNRLAMHYLASRLEHDEFEAHSVGYPSMHEGLDASAERLAQALHDIPGERIHLVGHSLGGLVVLRYLQDASDTRIARAVLLGAPIAGSQAGADLAGHAVGRWMLGHNAEMWHAPSEWTLHHEVGMIAGSHAFGLGALVTRFDDENDGAVTVAETRLAGLADHIVLPVSHSGMLLSAHVAQQTAAFLRRGRFDAETGQ